jgi:hypothetical protein
MRDTYVLASIMAMALVSPAWADPTPVAPSAAPPAPAAAADTKAKTSEEAKRTARDAEIVCYNDLDTGSHLRRTRVCMTRAQRDARQKEGHDAMDALKEAGRTPYQFMPGTPGGP